MFEKDDGSIKYGKSRATNGQHWTPDTSNGINPVIVVRFSAHNVFLKQVSLGTLKVKLFESQLILKLGSKGNQKQGRCNRRAPPKIGKNMIFWRKIVIFHTKYPNNFRASLRSTQFFLSVPP